MAEEPIKTNIIRIGNSQGIRIPKVILALSGIEDAVELIVRNRSIVIRPVKHVRSDWEASFEAMASHDDDKLLDEKVLTDWDEQEWEWE